MIWALLAGLICGFVGSIPIAGPTAVLIIERALAGERRAAFEIAVGAAIAESGYALLAFLGMTAFLSQYPWLLPVSRVLGALILLGVGLYLALARRAPRDPEVPARRAVGRALVVGLVVTGVNPTLLASWSAVVTVLHSTAALRVEPLDGFPFALGVGVGSALWFAALLAVLSHFRRRVHEATMERIVRVMGWLLVAAGVGLLAEIVRRHLS